MIHIDEVTRASLKGAVIVGDATLRDELLELITFTSMASRTEASKALLAEAILRDDTELRDELLSGKMAMPSGEDIDS